MEICVVYTPVENEKEARQLSDQVLSTGVAACTNIFPIHSMYPWEGRMTEDQEVVLLCKTLPSHQQACVELLSHQHNYHVPCIMTWSAEVNEAYGKWMLSVLRK